MLADAMATFILATTMIQSPEPLPVSFEEYACMVEAIHFESQGESLEGKRGVANTILKRMRMKRYPDTICGVIYQPDQFESFENGQPRVVLKNPDDERVFRDATLVALEAVQGRLKDNTGNADHFYAHKKTYPDWADAAISMKVIQNHTFANLYN